MQAKLQLEEVKEGIAIGDFQAIRHEQQGTVDERKSGQVYYP
jgi:hypothetical protein